MLFCLNAFRDDSLPEGAAKSQDRSYQLNAALVEFEIEDEALIDLEFIDREIEQVTERAVARAEIVERYADTEVTRFEQSSFDDGIV